MKTFSDRLREKIIRGGDSECWLWMGTKTKSGHGRIRCNGRLVLAHRAVYELQVGEIPEGMQIDHSCCNPSCCNPCHLRLATHAENTHNRQIQSNNTSGFKGVIWEKCAKKWRARIMVDSKSISLGVFDTPQEAHESYARAAKELHGDFSNSGRVNANR